MASDGSVSRLIDGVVVGDPVAIQQLWERYFHRLVGLARKRLEGASRRAADEEDVALSAFYSFCQNAEQGKFPHLLDRDGLWRLLVVITVRKAGHQLRDEGRRKRGGGMASCGEGAESLVLEEILSREPGPDEVLLTMEEYDRLLALLGDEELRQVALRRMQGYSIEEIATELDFAPRSIKRKVKLIRERWEREIRS